jgi:RimJ/RimL family protein N-acetyltransferase
VAERVPNAPKGFGPCEAIGVVSCGKLIAGVVYHEYRENCESIQISMAAESPMWARRGIIAGLLHYPFEQLGCWMIYTLIPPGNYRALRVNQHIGLKRKTVIPHCFGKKAHAVVCQMTRPEYQRLYIEGSHEQRVVRIAARCA